MKARRAAYPSLYSNKQSTGRQEVRTLLILVRQCCRRVCTDSCHQCCHILFFATLSYHILFYHHLLPTIAMLSDCIISLSNCSFTESATITLCLNTHTLQLILRLSLILPNVLLYPSDFSSYPSYDMMHLTSSYPALSFLFSL